MTRRAPACLALLFALVVTTGVSASSATAQEGAVSFQGDGMTVRVTSQQPASSPPAGTYLVRGTMALRESGAWPFEARLVLDPKGNLTGSGEVRPGQRRVAFDLSVDNQRVMRVVLAGTTYTLRSADAPKAATPGAGTAPPESTIRLEPKKIMDRQLEQAPFHAHTMLIPEGWSLQGETWGLPSDRYINVFPSLTLRVAAPDGREVYQAPSVSYVEPIYPMQQFKVGQPFEGMVVAPLERTHADLSRNMATLVIPKQWPGASDIRVTSIARVWPYYERVRSLWAEQFRQAAAQNNMGMGMKHIADCESVGIRADFTLDGKRYEVLRIYSRMWRGSYEQLNNSSVTMWFTMDDVTYKAPAGTLDQNLGLLRTVLNSRMSTPAWHRAMLRRAQILSKNTALISKMRQNLSKALNNIHVSTTAEVQKIMNQGHQNREKLRDAGHATFIRSIRETNFVTLPGSKFPLETSIHWNKIWSNGSSVIFSKDPKFDPGPGWDILQPHN